MYEREWKSADIQIVFVEGGGGMGIINCIDLYVRLYQISIIVVFCLSTKPFLKIFEYEFKVRFCSVF